MSNEPIPTAPADDDGHDPATKLIPALRLLAEDDALLCVDDACLPPDVRRLDQAPDDTAGR